MKIIRGRLKPQKGTTYEFISVKGRIKAMIEKLVNAAYAVDGGSVTGTYKITGTANGRSIYTLDGSHRFEYSGTRWELIKPGSDYQAAVGSETFPWDADWSLTPVTVTQATIGKGDNFDFVIDDGGRKSVMTFGVDHINPLLVGKEIPIISDDTIAKFNEDGTIEILGPLKEEALPRKETVEQLKRIRKASKGIDIGDRISKMYKQGSNIHYIQNPIDTGIESYEDFEKKNKGFIPSWNLKHLTSPFRGK